jgi:hypothetical protein
VTCLCPSEAFFHFVAGKCFFCESLEQECQCYTDIYCQTSTLIYFLTSIFGSRQLVNTVCRARVTRICPPKVYVKYLSSNFVNEIRAYSGVDDQET